MLKMIIGVVVCGAVISLCLFKWQENRDKNRTVVSGVITEVGSCGGGEGFFSGNYECKVAVKVGNNTEYWSMYGQAIKGQTVSRKCWSEMESGTKKRFCGMGE